MQKAQQSTTEDILWEALHSLTGATGRGNNAPFVELYLNICEQIRPQVSVEIGAREAAFSVKLKSRSPQTQCYAFEANPYVFEQFRNSAKDVTYLNEAIGAETGTRPFFIPIALPRPGHALTLLRTNPVSSLKLRAVEGVDYEEVSCKCDTLDAWHERLGWPASVLWIDVEGAVADVIGGATRCLSECVRCIFVELEKKATWKDQWLAPDVTAAMTRFGFRPVARDFETAWQYNQIFVRDELVTRSTLTLVQKYVARLMENSRSSDPAPPAAADRSKP